MSRIPCMLNYDSNRHNENKQMKSIYSGVDDDAIYVIYIRSETRCFVDIVFTIDDNVIYEGKRKKTPVSNNDFIFLDFNNKYLILNINDNINVNNNDNIIDNHNNLDAIKL